MTPARLHLPLLPLQGALRRALSVTTPSLRGAGGPEPGETSERDRSPLFDAQARRVSYLRISLTDRCNYRCTYCMPAEGVAVAPRAEVLSADELCQVVAVLRDAGLRRVRLTGGEPTVRPDVVAVVARLSALGLDDLALSTNGERLEELAAPLRAAGLTRLNVSLDTLDPARFQALTRRGHLDRVLAGLSAAQAAGFRHTKLNTVAMKGFNDDEVAALCRFAWDRGFVPRFIELMPMAEGSLFYPGTFLSAVELRQRLLQAFGPALPAAEEAELPGVGPARYLHHSYQGQRQRVGLISAVTEPFCATCNRVRLSATGALHMCLGHDDAVELRPLLRDGLSGAALEAALLGAVRDGLRHKRDGHEFQVSGCGGPRKHMVSIGG